MAASEEVEVFETFTRRWVPGFELVDARDPDWPTLRRADGTELPRAVHASRIRPATGPR